MEDFVPMVGVPLTRNPVNDLKRPKGTVRKKFLNKRGVIKIPDINESLVFAPRLVCRARLYSLSNCFGFVVGAVLGIALAKRTQVKLRHRETPTEVWQLHLTNGLLGKAS